MRKQLLSLRFGNKAFVFSLDGMMAITIVASMLLFSMFYITKAGDESVSKLQTIRIGYDVMAVLDNNGALDGLSVEDIGIELNRVLPINYHMRIQANCKEQDPIIVETTSAVPDNRFIGAGKRVFVTNTSKYCIADFGIWLK